MKNTARPSKIIASADGTGIISQAGAVLLAKTLQVTGPDRQLSAGLGRWRAPRAVHDPGKIVADLAIAVALGGDCLADIALLRAQPGLAGPVAPDPVVSRLIGLPATGSRALRMIRAAGAAARHRAWALAGDAAPGAGGGLVTVDIDATIVIAHSEKITAMACGLLAWMQMLAFDGPARGWEPKRLRCGSSPWPGGWYAPTAACGYA